MIFLLQAVKRFGFGVRQGARLHLYSFANIELGCWEAKILDGSCSAIYIVKESSCPYCSRVELRTRESTSLKNPTCDKRILWDKVS